MRIEHDYYYELTDDDRVLMAALVVLLGYDPDNISVEFAVEQTTAGCHLHLTEHLLDDQGHKYIDGTGEIACRRHVIPIDPQQLPASLRP